MEADHWGVKALTNRDELASVIRFTDSTNEYLKQVAIVYVSVRDVLGDRAEDPISDTYFFSGFLGAIPSAKSVEKRAAIAYLLSLTLPKISKGVLVAKAEEISKALIGLLHSHAEVVFLTRYTLSAISTLLRALPHNKISSEAGLKLVQAILVFSVDARPKIRHSAKKCVVNTFRSLANRPVDQWAEGAKSGIPPPVLRLLSKFIEHELSQCNRKDIQTALYICGDLQSIISTIPIATIVGVLTKLHDLNELGNPILAIQTLKVYNSLFTSGFSISKKLAKGETVEGIQLSPVDLQARLTHEANFVAHLLTSIIDLKPKVSDAEGASAFTNVIKSGFTCLHSLNASLAHQKIIQYMELTFEYLTSEKDTVYHAAAACIRAILRVGIDAELIQAAATALQSGVASQLSNIITTSRILISSRFRLVWPATLPIIETLFTVSNLDSAPLYAPLLKDLDIMYEGKETLIIQGVQRCIGAAIENLGPESVLAVLPLNLPVHHPTISIADQLENSRPWLLPLITENAKYTNLSLFTQHLLPSAETLLELSALSYAENKKSLTGMWMRTIAEQVLGTLPAFCNVPLDCARSFKPLAKELVKYLSSDDTKFAAPVISKSLRILISTNYSIMNDRWGKGEDITKLSIGGDDEPEGYVNLLDFANKSKSKINKKKAKGGDDESDDEEEEEEEEDSSASDASKEDVKPCPITKEQAAENIKVIAATAKNFLPVLFNVASTTRPEHRNGILGAIPPFTIIADAKVKDHFFKIAREKYIQSTTEILDTLKNQALEMEEDDVDDLLESDDEETQSSKRRKFGSKKSNAKTVVTDDDAASCRALADILMALLPGLPNECVESLYQAVIPHIGVEFEAIQKKAYQIIALIPEANYTFFSTVWRDILVKIMESASSVLPGCMKARLNCCFKIYCNIPNMLSHREVVQALPFIIIETIHCSKESSRRTREAADELIIGIGNCIYSQGVESGNGRYMVDFVHMIIAGLASAGSNIKSATITMLARVIFEFRNYALSNELISSLFETLSTLLESKSREIIKACLGFAKIVFLTLTKEELAPHIPKFILNVTNWPHDIKNRFKQRIRIHFSVLMRKLGSDYIRNLTPASDVRLIDHIRKTQEREERQKKDKLNLRKKEDAAIATKSQLMGDSAEDKAILGADRLGGGMSFEDIINDDSDDEDDGTSAADQLSREIKTSGVDAGASDAFNKKKKHRIEFPDMVISESADFLDPSISKQITVGTKHIEREEMGDSKSSIPLTKSGKFDITGLASSLSEQDKLSFGIKIDEKALNLKRRRAATGEDIDDKAAAATAARERKAMEDKRRKDGIYDAKTARSKNIGKSFASVKGAGDSMKRGAQHDPYAYIALDPRTMNKRKNKLDVESYEGAFAKIKTRHGQKAPRSQRLADRKRKEQYE